LPKADAGVVDDRAAAERITIPSSATESFLMEKPLVEKDGGPNLNK
jgi:hypothetical protein